MCQAGLRTPGCHTSDKEAPVRDCCQRDVCTVPRLNAVTRVCSRNCILRRQITSHVLHSCPWGDGQLGYLGESGAAVFYVVIPFAALPVIWIYAACKESLDILRLSCDTAPIARLPAASAAFSYHYTTVMQRVDGGDDPGPRCS